jgi:hypothetical protein
MRRALPLFAQSGSQSLGDHGVRRFVGRRSQRDLHPNGDPVRRGQTKTDEHAAGTTMLLSNSSAAEE